VSILRTRRAQGDRERAIELLKTTTLKYKEISEITGVPNGTINGLALAYRPEAIRRANSRKAGIENVTAPREVRGFQSGNPISVQAPEKLPEKVEEPKQKEDVPVPVATPSKGLSRTMIFSYEAKTDEPISKHDALVELKNIEGIMNSATGKEFTFSIQIKAKEGA
jgi:hypothetical protein